MQATHTNVKGARHCGMQGDAWPLRAPPRAGCRLPFSVGKYEPPRGALLGTRPAGDGPIFVVTLAPASTPAIVYSCSSQNAGLRPCTPARERPLRRFHDPREVAPLPLGPNATRWAARTLQSRVGIFHRGPKQAPHRAGCLGSTPSGAGRRRPRREPPRGALLGTMPAGDRRSSSRRSRPASTQEMPAPAVAQRQPSTSAMP